MRVSQWVLFTAITAAATFAAPSFADTGAAEELRAALKACKADSAATKSAESMIKKHGGKPTDDQVDDWVDEQEDELFDCLDKEL